MAQSEVQATMFPARTAVTAAVLAVLLGLAGACWVVAIHQMNGMDMGTRTQLGSFGFFIVVWVAMMVAMMLPGAIPAVLHRANAGGAAARCRRSSARTWPSGGSRVWCSMRCTGRTGRRWQGEW